MGSEGGKVQLPEEPRLRATFPKNALHKKIKVGLQVNRISTVLISAAALVDVLSPYEQDQTVYENEAIDK